MITPAEQIDFELNKQLLNRYRFIEHETVRILAAWLPATARMELKLAMGRWLWEDAQHVQQLYQPGAGSRGGKGCICRAL